MDSAIFLSFIAEIRNVRPEEPALLPVCLGLETDVRLHVQDCLFLLSA